MPDGSVFMRSSFAATSSSMRPFAGGACHTKPVRSPITVSTVLA